MLFAEPFTTSGPIVRATVYDPTKIDPNIEGNDPDWPSLIGDPDSPVLAVDFDLGCSVDSATFVIESKYVNSIVEKLESMGVSVGYETATEAFDFYDGDQFTFSPVGDGRWKMATTDIENEEEED